MGDTSQHALEFTDAEARKAMAMILVVLVNPHGMICMHTAKHGTRCAVEPDAIGHHALVCACRSQQPPDGPVDFLMARGFQLFRLIARWQTKNAVAMIGRSLTGQRALAPLIHDPAD